MAKHSLHDSLFMSPIVKKRNTDTHMTYTILHTHTHININTNQNKSVKPYKCFESQGHVKKKRPTVVASLILIACLSVKIIQR